MSRVESNESVLKRISTFPLYGDLSLTRDETINKIGYLLADISVSLAVIADALTENTKIDRGSSAEKEDGQ